MLIPNFNGQGPVGSLASQLGLQLDGRDPMDAIQENIKKRQKAQATGTPNNYSAFNPLTQSLLSGSGNQF